jgi:formylglycine-generating enzyme required for sulfatase activity
VKTHAGLTNLCNALTTERTINASAHALTEAHITVPAISFISYSNNDWDAAVELRERLRGVHIDCTELRLPGRWMTGLQQVLAACNAFIVLVGRDGVQRYVGAECEVALIRHFGQRADGPRLPIHPVLLPGTTAESLPPFLQLFQAETWAPGTELPPGLRQALLDGVERLQQAALFEGCPFRGLATFRREHAALFFGRQAETLRALAGLGDQLGTAPDALPGLDTGKYHRWLQVEGNSGSGKSSLVMAGLLPLVESGGLWARTGLANWRVLGPMVPGATPLTNLGEVLRKALHDGLPHAPGMLAVQQQLEADRRALAFAVREAKAPDTGYLLVVDQFEELYTLATEAERKRFDALLATALADAECPLFVVTTVRADFLDRIEQLPRLFELYDARCNRLFLSTISAAGLRDAIERPAALAGLDVSEVSTAMQEQARDEPGALPLVENALTQLWDVRHGHKISGDEFRARGGLTGMLSSGADALLARIETALPKQGRIAALELLLCLTRISPDGRHTRRRVSRAEAVQAAGNSNTTLGERVLQMLSGERAADRPAEAGAGTLRLVTAGAENAEPYVDLIHETPLRSRQVAGSALPQPYWRTLHAYIDANRDRDVLRQQLALHAERWQRAPRFTRWHRLASWWRQLDYRSLRPAPGSLEARFLASSRKATWVTAGVLSVTAAPFVATAVWAGANDLLSPAYVFVTPWWYLGMAVPADPQVVQLPPGRFEMGCKVGRDVDSGQSCDSKYDEPLRPVNLAQPCEMGQTAVTFWQYDYYAWNSRGGQDAESLQYPKAAGFGRADRPVINVNWHDAQGYARWLSKRTGQTWRLPTEEEWEYAARGGKEARYPWGDESPSGRANCADCGDRYSNRETAPVRSYAPNAYGLYDMTGNVWQWLQDYAPDDEALRALRGGSWNHFAWGLRLSFRFDFAAGVRYAFIGFRVCRVSPIEKPATGALPAEPLKR